MSVASDSQDATCLVERRDFANIGSETMREVVPIRQRLRVVVEALDIVLDTLGDVPVSPWLVPRVLALQVSEPRERINSPSR